MKFAVLALDYDGTVAVDGVLDPSVRHAIAELRQQRIAVVLVTGRRLADLRRVAGDLTCFDVVVGENGAVLEFPRHRPAPRDGPSPEPHIHRGIATAGRAIHHGRSGRGDG